MEGPVPDPQPTDDQPAPPPAVPRPRAARREQAAADVLRAFIRDTHLAQFGPIVRGRETLAFPIRLEIRPADNWALRFDPPLEEQVLGQLQDGRADHGLFRRGRAFCHRCDSSTCPHALPPDSLHVFAGYSPTGQPEWTELAQALIQSGDERAARLFGAHPAVLARVQFGRDLRRNQLASFGRASKTYAVLGQVVAGYFPVPLPHTPRGRPVDRLALTFQAVETRDPSGAFRLALNLLGRPPGEDGLEDLLAAEHGWAPAVYRARELAVRDLEELERQVVLARETDRTDAALAALKRIPNVLARLAESLERGDRQAQRRTRHAEGRRSTADRPVHKALEDALNAGADALFEDARTGGLVALGPQGRAHIFNETGRLITSFSLKPESVEYRLRTERWKRMDPDTAAAFRARIRPLAEGAIPDQGE